MKFFAEPNLLVRIANKHLQRALGKKGFYFDANGEYETEDPRIIAGLKQHYRFEETAPVTEPVEEVEEIIEETEEAPTVEDIPEVEEAIEETKEIEDVPEAKPKKGRGK